jgi:hypothetical protein
MRNAIAAVIVIVATGATCWSAAPEDGSQVKGTYCDGDRCEAVVCTVGQLREAGYEVRGDDQGQYVLIKGSVAESDGFRQGLILERVARIQAHRQEMAAKGEGYLVPLRECKFCSSVPVLVTVGQLRRLGYAVRVDDDDQYVFSRSEEKPAGVASAQAEIQDEIMNRKDRQEMASEGDGFVTLLQVCRLGVCGSGRITVGELRQLGYEARIDDDGIFVFSRLGEAPRYEPSAQAEIQAEIWDQYSAKRREKVDALIDGAKAGAARLGQQ